MEIDHQAPLANRKEIVIGALPQKVWKLQSDINSWSQWQTHIAFSKIDGPLRAGTIFHWRAGGLKITSTLQEVKANKRIGWTGVAFGTRACHIFTFEPHKNGTLVIAEESLSGWLAHFMKFFMPNFLEESMQSSLENLKRKAEGNNKSKKAK